MEKGSFIPGKGGMSKTPSGPMRHCTFVNVSLIVPEGGLLEVISSPPFCSRKEDTRSGSLLLKSQGKQDSAVEEEEEDVW